MTPTLYRYSFDPCVPLPDVEAALVLAIAAAESLHGEAQVRLDVAHALDGHTCVVDAGTPAGRDVNRLFAGFLARELGPDAFAVERLTGDAVTAL